jgi:hypothetical protein
MNRFSTTHFSNSDAGLSYYGAGTHTHLFTVRRVRSAKRAVAARVYQR